MADRKKVPDKADDKDQSERFIETARKHGTDETGEAFERAFKAAVPARQKNRGQKKK